MYLKKLFTGILLLSTLLSSNVFSAEETPDYNQILKEGAYEIRDYPPILVAQATGGNLFRTIADYIFGNNKLEQNISMTAPVQQKENQKIAMTAPVQQQLNGKSWRISFVMPSEYSFNSLPVPNDNRVRLKKILAKKFIVIEFSGTYSNENVEEHENQLMNYIETNKINIISSPKYAFYNAPWTLPFLRRNEIMIEIN